jgi:ADP-ribose pyrophosphatase YjhB (NUDIX family)
MHNKIYASGFLYHPETTQILLQQKNSSDPNATWSLLGGLANGAESPEATFKRIVEEELGIILPIKSIHQVYDYVDEVTKEVKHICYSQTRSQKDFKDINGTSFAWFTLKEISKLKISPQAKQDIIVGQRVIDSTSRRNSGEQTIG